MPVFEGLGSLGSDKNSVVLEIGNAFTRCGFVNEFSPRAIVRSETKATITHQSQKLADMKDESTLYNALKEFIEGLYFKFLAVNPKDRKVLVVESVLSSKIFRSTLAKVLFGHFDVPALLFVPGHLMSLVTLVINTGIVVDVGYNECSVTAVIEGVTVLYSSKFAPLGAKAVHDRIRSELIDNKATIKKNGGSRQFTEEDNLEEKVLEDIKAKACVVPSFGRGQDLVRMKMGQAKREQIQSGGLVDVDYHLDGSTVLTIPGIVREQSGQIFFEVYGNEMNIPTMILDTIRECPIDSRKLLCENIVVIGGSSMMPGFIHRLFHEIKNYSEQIPTYKTSIPPNSIKIHRLPCKPNYAAWLGAAIFGSTDAMSVRAVTRDQHLRSKGCSITDWSEWWPQK